MDTGIVMLLLFGFLVISLLLGVPFAFALGGVGIVMSYLFWSPQSTYLIAADGFAKLSAFYLIAIPLFIFMALVLERSGIADAAYTMMHLWLGGLKGGLAIGTVIICTAFAAMSGISGAATVSMGVIALPAMLKRGYQKEIAIGCIAAGGALGILIPPSITMIIFGVSGMVSVGRLFAGGLFPGLLLSGLFILYIFIRVSLQPHLAPSLPPEERPTWHVKLASLKKIIAPVVLIIAVLGSIFTGIASVSEAAAIGAFGSLVCAAIYRKLNWQVLKESCVRSLSLSGMVMWIIWGAISFSAFFSAMGTSRMLQDLVAQLEVNRWIILIGIQVILLLLGMIMETTAIIMVTVPVFLPLVIYLGFDPIWYGVLFVMNMEMGFLTPPFGYNLFYMKGVAPPGVTMGDIYRSIIPFVGLQALGLAIAMVFPEIILFMPRLIFGS